MFTKYWKRVSAVAAVAVAALLTWSDVPSVLADFTWEGFRWTGSVAKEKSAPIYEQFGAKTIVADSVIVNEGVRGIVLAPEGCPAGSECLRATAHNAIVAHAPIVQQGFDASLMGDEQPLRAANGFTAQSAWSSTSDDKAQLERVLGATGAATQGGTASAGDNFTILRTGASRIVLPGGPANWSANGPLYVRYNGSTKRYYWSTSAPTDGYAAYLGRLLTCAADGGNTACGVVWNFGGVERFLVEGTSINRTVAGNTAGSSVLHTSSVPSGYYGAGDLLRITVQGIAQGANITHTLTQNPSASSATENVAIPTGYYSGRQATITIPGDPDLVAGNIRRGRNLFGVSGSLVPQETTTFSGADVRISGRYMSLGRSTYSGITARRTQVQCSASVICMQKGALFATSYTTMRESPFIVVNASTAIHSGATLCRNNARDGDTGFDSFDGFFDALSGGAVTSIGTADNVRVVEYITGVTCVGTRSAL